MVPSSAVSQSPLAGPLGAVPDAPREVVRCQECQLVQFRTMSDLCRRCAKPLPTWVPFGANCVAEETPQSLEAGDLAETDPPTDRAGRNRRVPLGTKIKEIREERGLTQVEMAALLGIPRSYLSRIENRRLLPGPMMVAKFAEALQMDIAELLPPERRKDGARLFPSDPGLAALYTQIAMLPAQELAKILAIVRRMVPGGINPRRTMGVPAGPSQRPAVLPARP